MYEILNSFKWKTHPKISIITHQFWKTPKPKFQNMKCMKNERLEAYQGKKILEKLEETLRIKIGVRWEFLGEKKERVIEREIEENGRWIA